MFAIDYLLPLKEAANHVQLPLRSLKKTANKREINIGISVLLDV